MKRYKIVLSYDGTHYSGWQIQPNAPSIQESLEKALEIALKKKMRVIGSGRTDAGVHAHNQVAHFSDETSFDCRRLLLSLNGILPHDIRVKILEETSPSFHAQINAQSKIYHYHLWIGITVDPFYRLYRHRIGNSFSLERLKEGISHFLGTHDFTTFTNVGGSKASPIRTLYRIDCIEEKGGYRLEFEGSGFGYKMVRNLVGILLEVATGKLEARVIPSLLEAKDRRQAPMAAPARGLFLAEVLY